MTRLKTKLRAKGQRLKAKGNPSTDTLGPWPLALGLVSFPGIFGTIKNPLGTAFDKAGEYSTVTSGLPLLISNIVRLVTIAAGLWMFFNFIVAGFTYISAAGDSEKIKRAWTMIWQSLIGLVIVVAAFIIAGIASQILFGDVGTILNPVIYGPGDAQ